MRRHSDTSAFIVPRAYVSPEDAGLLCQAMEEPYSLLAALIYSTGIRLEEALAIDHFDVIEEERKIHIRGRESRDRFVKVPEVLMPGILGSLPDAREPDTLIFRGAVARSFYHHLEAARILSGIPGTTENLRGSFAINLARAGIGRRAIRQAMGIKRASETSTISQYLSRDLPQ